MDSALLVGSDTQRLKTIFTTLSELGWQLKVITQPQTIMQVLDQEENSIFFCDEALKGATIGGVCAIISRKVPEAEIHVFRSSDKPLRTPKPISGELAFPPEPKFLPKPKLLVPSADDDAKKTFVPFEGNSSMVSLIDIINAMAMDKRNALIDFDRGKLGLIYVHAGIIEHAMFFEDGASIKGLKALGKLVNLEEAPFRVLNYQPSGTNSINLPADTAMTEAARIADEEAKYLKLLVSLRQICPSITDIAIGYPMSSKPIHGYGDSEKLFELSKVLLEKGREAIKGRLNEFFLSTDSVSYSLTHLDEGNLLIASAPAKDRLRLQEALRTVAVASYA